ncbi:RBR-type E3 ubiquitin transferase [Quillaja saponaria]|uniref:RBR-type E3 ubiquitin transferase n=1 Tax=Quillaja saponaria TaxID=32244 RepID=A0AAD7LS64_QUISA|nr:RBR-type E3 ubiquitin transferase [Quillaja saponaria]
MKGASSSSNDTHFLVDDFYFSALHDNEEIFPISDEKYAEELQLQEALMSSAVSSRLRNESVRENKERNSTITHLLMSIKGKEKEITTGQSSQSSFCLICMEAKPVEEMFKNPNCSDHSFCFDCIGKYVATRIQENISMVKCPEPKCRGLLEPQFCRSIIPKEVFDRWEEALCESLVLGSQKFYCPFKDCSAMLVDDGEEVVTTSECPNCRRLFCAQCGVSWHAGIDCGDFQKLKEGERQREDIMVIELAKNKAWRRCPNCKFYVEKVDGCSHISCRCGCHFCYGCGGNWNQYHACRSS